MEGALRGSTQLVHHIVTTKNEYEEVNKLDNPEATPSTQELGTRNCTEDTKKWEDPWSISNKSIYV